MPSTVTVSSVFREGDKIFIRFSDGTEREFASLADLKSVLEMDQNKRIAQDLFLAWWLARSNDATNEAIIEGKTMTFNMSAPNAIKVQ